jgi:glycosyltransferase involved in cell wall biosynthesis
MLFAMEKLTMSSAHHVLAVSTSLRRRAIDMRLVDSPKITVLGAGSSNGVDVDLYSGNRFLASDLSHLKSQLGLVDGVPVIGFVGRLTNDKGVHVLAGARAILVREGIDHQVLVVGGIDDETGRPSLKNDECRPARMTGRVSNPEIYYQLMDVLCLPTLREGFPNVVLEAAVAGVPTVTTNATGAVDSVVDGKTGLLAQVGSAESLAQKLGLMLTDTTLRMKLGQEAAEWVPEHFDRVHVWARLNAYYSNLLKQASHD